jgi:hypothetical protein
MATQIVRVTNDIYACFLPGSFPVHLLKVNTTIHDQVLPASGLIARDADPNLVVDHPQKQGW